MNNKNKGFTLVELSIVLVIIGLLIGGLLVAQSLIGSTKIQSTIRQLGQFDASVATFYSKFNQIPGDASVMGEAAGNNDGWIDDSATTTHTVANWDGEIGKFWYDLSVNGLKPTGTSTSYLDCSNLASATNTNCDAALPAGTLVNTYVPEIPISNNIGVMAFGTAAQTNYYAISNFSTTITTGEIALAPTSGLLGADAVAIDSKIDDGDADAGSVLGDDGTVLAIAEDGTTCASAAGAYVTSGTTAVCNLFVRVGVQTGNLQ